MANICILMWSTLWIVTISVHAEVYVPMRLATSERGTHTLLLF